MGKNTAQQIQKNAIELFRQHGYSKVAILDTCHATGISKSMFYYRYPSKDTLLTDFYKYTINIPQETMRLLGGCWLFSITAGKSCGHAWSLRSNGRMKLACICAVAGFHLPYPQ